MSNRHAFRQGSMHRAAQGDLRQTLPLLVAEVAAEQQLQVDAVDLPLARIARDAGLDPVERPALAFGIQPNREDRSGAERGEHRLGRRRPSVLSALVHRLVHQQPVRTDARFRLQIAQPGHLDGSCHVIPLC
jgi:hypothetical protein